MTDTKPATEADVVEAMVLSDGLRAGDPGAAQFNEERRQLFAAALTAARALGVLLPEEAARLRAEYARAEEMRLIGQIQIATLQANLAHAERNCMALATRLKRAEEALRLLNVWFENSGAIISARWDRVPREARAQIVKATRDALNPRIAARALPVPTPPHSTEAAQ